MHQQAKAIRQDAMRLNGCHTRLAYTVLQRVYASIWPWVRCSPQCPHIGAVLHQFGNISWKAAHVRLATVWRLAHGSRNELAFLSKPSDNGGFLELSRVLLTFDSSASNRPHNGNTTPSSSLRVRTERSGGTRFFAIASMMNLSANIYNFYCSHSCCSHTNLPSSIDILEIQCQHHSVLQ